MSQDNRELEVKFAVRSVEDVLPRIHSLEAVCEQPTQFESNIRWDDHEGTLTNNHQVLRLRNNGGTAVLTYKAENKNDKRLADREEIETVVTNFENTKLILERLGYQIVFIYEKYRSIYRLNETGIFADHTPIGDFIEIEGPDEEAIRRSAEMLGLDWEERISKGDRILFAEWKQRTAFPGRDMIFTEE